MALGKGLSSLIPQQAKVRDIIRKETGLVPQKRDAILQVPISEITPNSEQPRKEFNHQDLEDLVASIKKHGILQPLVVTERSEGGYELIAGERRLRASQIAGLATVPVIVRTATQQERLELALIENIQRQALNAIEEAYAYSRLMEEFNLTQAQVAEQVGKSRPAVANTIRLLDLPSVIQKALISGEINAGKARALLSLKDEAEQIEVFQSMAGREMSVRALEAEVSGKGAASRKGSVRRDPNLSAQERMLEDRLHAKVRITRKGDRGTIVIDYHTREELKRILEEIL
ncbi:MAG TPA: ParB/RepB/Spo0J family partition protein [Candidatus Magasanikbacteria bacterium]|nr:ParB/RepB/Spo0J family partition protein [Candidatus Magasanikbacteria bacterium]